MATVTVFVDDAVRGRLPRCCAKSGEPCDAVFRIDEDLSGGLGAAWVLLFFGPLGWLVLALIAASRRHRYLSVRLPYDRPVIARYRRARRAQWWSVAAIPVSVGSMFLLGRLVPDAPSSVLIAGAMVGVIGGLVCFLVAAVAGRRELVGVSLDASGRWVTLSRVHESFAAACRSAQRSEDVRA